jgi:O-Antigen ligase
MRDPNMYGASIALSILSAGWLTKEAQGGLKYFAFCTLPFLLAGIFYTQSRGVLFSLLIPLLFLMVNHARPQTRLFFWAMLNLCFISLLVGFEDVIAKTLCQWVTIPRCASSARYEIWGWTIELIKDHPLLGVGAGFRFDHIETGQVSPHHVLWGTALYFGIPMMVVFIATLYSITKSIEPHAPILSAFFIFGWGFMATNLAQPFAFINYHYLFLWLPLYFYASPIPLQRQFIR